MQAMALPFLLMLSDSLQYRSTFGWDDPTAQLITFALGLVNYLGCWFQCLEAICLQLLQVKPSFCYCFSTCHCSPKN